MKKKTFVLSLLFVMMISVLAACGGDGQGQDSKSASELIREAAEKQFELNSVHGVVDASLNLDVPSSLSSNPNFAMLAMMKEIGVKIEQFSDMENEKAYITAQVEGLAGMDLNAEAFVNSAAQLVLQTPMVPQAIVINKDDLIAEMERQTPGSGEALKNTSFTGKVSEEQKETTKAALDLYGEAFKDENPTESKEEIEFTTGKEELSVFTYSYKGDEVFSMFERVIKNSLSGEKLIPFLEQVEKSSVYSAENSNIDIEAIKSNKEAALKEFEERKDEFFDQIKQVLTINEMTLKMGIDKDGFMRYSSIVFDLSVTAPQLNGEKAGVRISLDVKNDQINSVKAEDIKTIEVDETNSVNFLDLMKQPQ